jgi:hypothetical protein
MAAHLRWGYSAEEFFPPPPFYFSLSFRLHRVGKEFLTGRTAYTRSSHTCSSLSLSLPLSLSLSLPCTREGGSGEVTQSDRDSKVTCLYLSTYCCFPSIMVVFVREGRATVRHERDDTRGTGNRPSSTRSSSRSIMRLAHSMRGICHSLRGTRVSPKRPRFRCVAQHTEAGRQPRHQTLCVAQHTRGDSVERGDSLEREASTGIGVMQITKVIPK